jgi:flagellar hook-length control protein FliK
MTGPAPAPAPQATPASNAPAGSAATQQSHGAADPRATATGPPGSGSSPPAFASVLQDQVARTALAEGQRELDPAHPPPAAGNDALQPGASADDQTAASLLQAIANGTAVTAAPLPTAPAAPQAPSSGEAPTATSATAPSPTLAATEAMPTPSPTPAATEAMPTPAPSPAAQLPATTPPQPAPGAAAITAGPAAAGASAAPATPATPSQVPAAAGDPQPLPPTTQPPAHAPQAAAHPAPEPPSAPTVSTSSPAVTVQTPGATASQSGTPSDPQQQQQQPAAAHAAEPATLSSSQPATTPALTFATVQAPEQPVTTSAAPAPTASVAAPHAGVALDHAVETVRMTIELAGRQGYSQARIQLSPPELGDIRIHLHQTSDGLVARVVAAHAGAAQALQHGGAELRRSLEAAGMPLLRLDIESSDQRGHTAHDPNRTGSGVANDGAGGDEQQEPLADEPGTLSLTVTLPSGAVVDVLA